MWGAGAAVSGHGTNYGTVLAWDGAAGGVVIDASNNSRRVCVRDLQIDNLNSSTAAGVAIRVNSTDSFCAENVVVYPRGDPPIGFSTAAIDIGNSANVVDVSLTNVYLRENAVGLRLGSVSAHVVGVNLRCVQNTTNLIIGSAQQTFDAISVHFFGCTFEGAPNSTSVSVERGINVAFHGCYFENDGNGYAIDVPNNAARAWNISAQGCYFVGNAFSALPPGTTAAAIHVDFASAYLNVSDSYFVQYNDNAHMVKNDDSARVVLFNNDANYTGAQEITSYAVGSVITVGNSLAGVVANNRIAASRAYSYTVANLPAGMPAGSIAYASNGRKQGQGAGQGTGTLCYYDGVAWRRVADDTTMQA